MRTKSESLLPPSFDVLALENLSRTCESLLPAGSPTRGIACGRRLADNCPPVVAKDLPIPGENSPSHRQFSSEVPPNACFNAYGGSGGPPTISAQVALSYRRGALPPIIPAGTLDCLDEVRLLSC